MQNRSALYAAIGARLTHYDIDVEQATLVERETLELPEGLQYMWRHTSQPVLYAACSDGRPGFKGSRHVACALRMEPDGKLALLGSTVTLPLRPVHITTDAESRHLVIVYPFPSVVEVRRINADGSIGELVAQPNFPELSKTAHQAMFTPSGDRMILPLRGNHGGHGAAEDPGALAIFGYRDGILTHRQTIAPDGGFGFGARHVDFHPRQPWMFMCIERQNQIALFELGDQVTGPNFRTNTLARPDEQKPRQLGGAIHVHPNGRFVYLSNRSDGTVEFNGHKVSNGGENNIAVFAINDATGQPTLIQNADTQALHPRTFHIDPSGKLLVAANMTTGDVRDGDTVRNVPGALSVFRIGDDGRLTFVRKYDADTSQDLMFWMGIVPLP